MKNTSKLFALLATCVMSAISAPALAAEAQAAPQSSTSSCAAVSRVLSVAGLGEVMVQPDSLRTSVSIRARAESLERARVEVAEKTQAVIAAMTALRIPSLQVRTVEITVTPIPERESQPGDTTTPRIVGYQAESTLSVALRSVASENLRVLGPQILETALASGANVVGGIEFFLSKPREAHRLALAAAMQDAEANAKVVAGAARIKLRGVKSISTESGLVYGYAQQAMSAEVMEANAVGFPVEPGEIRVTTQVTASFVFTK
jgi:uncharacterized protein YggE